MVYENSSGISSALVQLLYVYLWFFLETYLQEKNIYLYALFGKVYLGIYFICYRIS